ncbi:helix-turn-helix domain-containing protein [Levilactobacillus brevis]|uniref:HTH cro/C1-type domain-containing protein n=2 Tax=Levilactobacillus TaxID=2767886 RepID=M5AHD5_LEVBR|nr:MULTISPECIES: helix-turn-helix domain-containing protein [Levilactobacillus]ARW23111.1 hypothetical protein S101174_02304 [Levilactobacillus brevis]MCS8597083.1 helix-turn-helix domain-containing protein [Levilactobacillus brevis]NRD28649.1 helix-turn-helix domain-containing protein [Levilactobacillus brevis]ODP93883.1 hypothetical protein BGC39_05630 [Levilactobacillus brevis]BAN07757.1 hypothetical protein LVISKB_2122 [Levilactobacillus brevis KB290]
MAQISKDMLTAVRRKRGELNLNVLSLSKETGVSRWTLDKILTGERTNVRVGTANKLNDWLYKQV